MQLHLRAPSIPAADRESAANTAAGESFDLGRFEGLPQENKETAKLGPSSYY